MGSDTILQA